MANKIMIIDDEVAMCRILKQMLEGEGYEVHTSTDAQSALEAVKSDSFNLVMTDVSMPNLSGIEILSELKKEKPALPVIFVTAQDINDVLKEALQLGLDGFIEKPFNLQALLEIVRDKIAPHSNN